MFFKQMQYVRPTRPTRGVAESLTSERVTVISLSEVTLSRPHERLGGEPWAI
jgi:hypothetical protein